MPATLSMTFQQWITYQLDPCELILNASAVDGSDFHQHHPIGLAVFAIPALPQKMADCRFVATQDNLCSAMFQPGTRVKPNQHRVARLQELTRLDFVSPVACSVQDHRISAQEYMAQLCKDLFTCSPRGHGVDCHRNYEAILCKCIPLITGADESMKIKYAGLPVIFLENYAGLTAGWLAAQYARMLDTVYDFAPLTRSYWYAKRPDVNIDMQSEKWMRKFQRWDQWKQYVLCKPQSVR